MIAPPRWVETELEAQRRVAIARFREERMREPLLKYMGCFDRVEGLFRDLIDWLLTTGDPRQAPDDVIARVLSSRPHLEAFRYLAAPPISADDLQVLADAPSLTPNVIAREPERARAVYATIVEGLDRRRFPWIGRAPTEAERRAAVVASAALLATRRAETDRRQEGKSAQEARVTAALDEIGLVREAARSIQTLDAAPGPGRYCGESLLGSRKADVVVRLRDRRVLAIECKVSNSGTNSIKRLNNDAAVKAVQWLREFGVKQLVPAAMLSGVFNLRNLADAQADGLTLFWAHDLARLQHWIAEVSA